MVELLDPPMTEREAKPKRDDTTAKIDREVLSDCQTVARSRGISTAEYISERLRPLVKQDIEAELERRRAPTKPPKPKR